MIYLFFIFDQSGSSQHQLSSGVYQSNPYMNPMLWPGFRHKQRRGVLRRAVFSDSQRKGLEAAFLKQKYISKPDRKKLAAKLCLKDSQVSFNCIEYFEIKSVIKEFEFKVKIWFQNRRMKWRNSKERELMKAKSLNKIQDNGALKTSDKGVDSALNNVTGFLPNSNQRENSIYEKTKIMLSCCNERTGLNFNCSNNHTNEPISPSTSQNSSSTSINSLNLSTSSTKTIKIPSQVNGNESDYESEIDITNDTEDEEDQDEAGQDTGDVYEDNNSQGYNYECDSSNNSSLTKNDH